jgi:hypothetical protein
LLVQFFDAESFSENLTNRIVDPLNDPSNYNMAAARVVDLPFWNRRRSPWDAVVE